MTDHKDAERFRKLAYHTAACKVSFGPANKARELRMHFKASVMTSAGYQNELRRMVDDLPGDPDAPTGPSDGEMLDWLMDHRDLRLAGDAEHGYWFWDVSDGMKAYTELLPTPREAIAAAMAKDSA